LLLHPIHWAAKEDLLTGFPAGCPHIHLLPSLNLFTKKHYLNLCILTATIKEIKKPVIKNHFKIFPNDVKNTSNFI